MSEDLLSGWARHAFSLSIGLGVILLLAEGWRPQNKVCAPLGHRWVANLLTYASTVVLIRWLPQLSLLGTALLTQQNGWGLLHLVNSPPVIALVLGWLAVDLSGYLVHRLEHASPLLWRIHRLHHSDPDVDVTTTYRFHPLEVLLRAGAHVLVVVAVGVPPLAAVGYILLSSLTSVLSHANLRLPRGLDQALGMLVITPNIHRTHHSIDIEDANSNFSVCLSCWDRLFGTFRAMPKHGFGNIIFGVEGRTTNDATSILRMLADPFLPARAPAALGTSVTLATGDVPHRLE